jgi:hypothetical protein
MIMRFVLKEDQIRVIIGDGALAAGRRRGWRRDVGGLVAGSRPTGGRDSGWLAGGQPPRTN